MYHEIENVTQTLVDIGFIAQRLRNLEKLWNTNLKELQKQSIRSYNEPLSLKLKAYLNTTAPLSATDGEVADEATVLSPSSFASSSCSSSTATQETVAIAAAPAGESAGNCAGNSVDTAATTSTNGASTSTDASGEIENIKANYTKLNNLELFIIKLYEVINSNNNINKKFNIYTMNYNNSELIKPQEQQQQQEKQLDNNSTAVVAANTEASTTSSSGDATSPSITSDNNSATTRITSAQQQQSQQHASDKITDVIATNNDADDCNPINCSNAAAATMVTNTVINQQQTQMQSTVDNANDHNQQDKKIIDADNNSDAVADVGNDKIIRIPNVDTNTNNCGGRSTSDTTNSSSSVGGGVGGDTSGLGVGGGGSVGGGGRSGGSCCAHSLVNAIQLENQQQLTQICDKLKNINEDDLKNLVLELKSKIDYTEKMNWLCLSNRPNTPTQRKTSLTKHSDVKKHFLEICDNTLTDDVKAALRLPSFDSYNWEDWEVIHLMQTMFTELNLLDKFNIPISTLREWLYEVYKHYNDVPFHNYRHCFCVAQMMYAISWQTNLIARLGEFEVLILLISCICHDLDHPGYNNIYQINAQTELALRYNDISPLENHHCSIAFRVFEHPDCNIFQNMSKEMYKKVREGIIRCILATDMARHNEILTQFQEAVPHFDYDNNAHTNLLCMILIKVADISNEARPMDVAEPWVDRLLQEFFAQSAAEKSEGLPVTPFMDPDKVSKPGSQVRFIGLVLLPLFEALGELLPELTDFIIIPVRVALDYYKRLNDASTKSRKSLAENEPPSENGSPMLPRSQSGISVRSKRSIPSQKSASRNSIDESILISAELHDLPEGSESGDSETATEVEVAEKTSKFKVDTESGNRSKHTHSSVKKSREKRPSMVGEMGYRIRGSYDQYSNNRRMSDGLQAVISDNSVFYNQRQHRSLDHEVMYSSVAERPNLTPYRTIEDCEPVNLHSCFGTNKISALQQTNIKVQTVQTSNNNINMHNNNNNNNNNTSNNNNNNNNNINSSPSNGTRSIISRLKQLTGRLSFSFDTTNKDTKRLNNSNITSNIKNNNGDELQLSKTSGYCCHLNMNQSSIKPKYFENSVHLQNVPESTTISGTTITATTATSGCGGGGGGGVGGLVGGGGGGSVVGGGVTRNRTYSLDVPNKLNRYSSSSCGDSRKSIASSNKNDENNYMDDSNSNHTLTNNNKNID